MAQGAEADRRIGLARPLVLSWVWLNDHTFLFLPAALWGPLVLQGPVKSISRHSKVVF